MLVRFYEISRPIDQTLRKWEQKRNLKKNSEFWNLNAKMNFFQIQSEMSSNIRLFMKILSPIAKTLRQQESSDVFNEI